MEDLYNWVIGWAQTGSAELALLCLAFAESSFFPVPPDILLIAMGVADPERALFYALLTSIGSVAGGATGYGIGRWGGRPIIKKIISERNRNAVERLYNRYDLWAIVIAGLTPLPYKIFTLTAGIFHIRFRNFLIASIISRPARFFLVGGALTIWGQTIQEWIENYFNIASIIFVVLLVGGFLVVRWFGRKKIQTI